MAVFDFYVSVRGRDTPPAPLERGGFGWCFFVGNEWVECEDSPLERGILVAL